MFGLLLALLILDGILLSVVVLLQAGKGGGLAAMGGAGTDNFIGGRQAATILTKTTWIAGGLFMGLSLMLAIASSRQQQPESILRDQFEQAAPAPPQPILPGAQPQEQRGQQEQGGAATTTQTPPASPQGEDAAPPAQP